ncbi:MAG TPA: DNA repair protein MmcB-related protein [Rhodospirillaceae bacterium]|nr:hypothetical protein [Rhodospirillaceae bacterium]HAT34573.1 DNA repair protein MmcB-related protein [Rhodospirillaceae bacterium]|tara:strand:- start:264 stop:722 length:459 start_codon:yes stop_codon:yes gene_type:complete
MPDDATSYELDKVAAGLARGLSRYFGDLGQVCLTEFRLKNRRRADVIALDRNGDFTIVEIKSSRADFMTDHKWQEYLEYCDRFYFAVDENFPAELIPDSCGLIIADRFGAAVVRESSHTQLHASRRKALSLRFARTATRRLMDLTDPGPAGL